MSLNIKQVDTVKRQRVLNLLKAIDPFPARGDTRLSLRENKNDKYYHFALGKVIKLDEKYQVLSAFNVKYPELYAAARDLIRDVLPNWHFHCIQINKNYKSLPHKDRNNQGLSYIIGLGNYKGGSLLVGDDLKPVDVHNRLVQFDGKQLHATAPFTGTRYSLIYFKLNRPPPPRNIIAKASKSPKCKPRATKTPQRWNSRRT